MGKSVFYKKIVVVALAIINTVFGTVNALAAGNNYGITYSTSGAQQLGSNNNVIQDADLVNDLTTLIKSNETRTQFQGSWQTGYISDTDQCKQIKYFRVSSNSPRTESDNFGFTFSNNNDLYRAEVKIKGASLFPQSSLQEMQLWVSSRTLDGFTEVGR